MLCLTAVVDLASGNIVNMHEVPANPVKLRDVLKKASAFFRFIFRPAFLPWLLSPEKLDFKADSITTDQGRVGFFRRLLSSEVLEEEGPETMGGELRAGFFRWLFASEKLPEEAPQKLKR